MNMASVIANLGGMTNLKIIIIANIGVTVTNIKEIQILERILRMYFTNNNK